MFPPCELGPVDGENSSLASLLQKQKRQRSHCWEPLPISQASWKSEATFGCLLLWRGLERRLEEGLEGAIVGLVLLVEPLQEQLEGSSGGSNMIALDGDGAGEGVFGLHYTLFASRLLLLGAFDLGLVSPGSRRCRWGYGRELGTNGH